MAPCLREHLANKGRPNEAEQMVGENSPIAPCEQPAQWERGARGQSRGGFISRAGFVNGCLETLLEGERPEVWRAELKGAGFFYPVL